MTTNETISRRADELKDELIRIRRTIHENPELGFEEYKTAELVSQTLDHLGIALQTGVGKTGVVGLIEGKSPGRTLAIRADMDCLPQQELTGLPFASKVPGRMHACGHDVHTTILLGVAMILSEMRDRLRGRVKLVFQPNEEGLIGAQAMIEDGVFDNPRIDMCLGFHNSPLLETGKIGYYPEVAFASSDAFDLTLKGLSGHGAHPHLAIDVITAAAFFVTQLQTVVSREIAALQPAVISIGQIEGGTARNILPDSVFLQGTVRTHDASAKEHIEKAMRRMLEALKAGMRVEYDLKYQKGVPVLRHDREILRSVLESAADILGDEKIEELKDGSMGSDDFSLFAEAFPGAHIRIGSKIEGLTTALHRSNYDCNEAAIPTGVCVVTRAALDLLA